MDIYEKAVAQLESCGIDAFEDNDTVYVTVNETPLEIAIYEIEFRANLFDEEKKEKKMTKLFQLTDGDGESMGLVKTNLTSQMLSSLWDEYYHDIEGGRFEVDELSVDEFIEQVDNLIDASYIERTFYEIIEP